MSDLVFQSIPFFTLLLIGAAYAIAPSWRGAWTPQRPSRNSNPAVLNKRGQRLVRLMGFTVAVASLVMLGNIWIGYQIVVSTNAAMLFGITMLVVLGGTVIVALVLMVVRPQLMWKGQAQFYENPASAAPNKGQSVITRIGALIIIAVMIYYVLRFWPL